MIFEILSALLLVLALALIAPPLLRRRVLPELDRKQQNVAIARERLDEIAAEHAAGEMTDALYQQSREELEVNLLEDVDDSDDADYEKQATQQQQSAVKYGRAVFILLIILIPLASVGLYAKLGSPEYLSFAGASAGNAHVVEQMAAEAPSMEQLIKRLLDHLQNQPDDGDAWFMLAKTYMAAEMYADALSSLEKAEAIVGEHPSILLGKADASAMLNEGNLTGQPTEFIERALQLDPKDSTALWLGGMSAQQNGNFQLAVERWLALIPRLKDDAESTAQLKSLISEAIAQAKQAGTPVVIEEAIAIAQATQQDVQTEAPQTSVEAQPLAADQTVKPSVKVWISLADSVRDRVKPGDTLFVFAKATSGPPMPLAAYKGSVADLPFEVTLDDSMAMMPQMKISNFEQVSVSARIAKGGTPQTQPGDITSEAQVVKLEGVVGVELLLDTVVE